MLPRRRGQRERDDGALVNRLNERVRAEVQALVRRALDERGPAF